MEITYVCVDCGEELEVWIGRPSFRKMTIEVERCRCEDKEEEEK